MAPTVTASRKGKGRGEKVRYDEPRIRAKGLVVTRESDKYNLALFNGMRDQTYRDLRHIPAIRAVEEVGLVPLDKDLRQFFVERERDGVLMQEPVYIRRRSIGRTRATIFEHDGYWHMWTQSSAALETNKGQNEFTMLLRDVIKELSPQVVYAANTSRLVRAHSQAKRLQLTLGKYVDRIVCSDADMILDGGAGPGSHLLDTLTMIAAMERNMIVQRTLTGRLFRAKNGGWPFGAMTQPYGFELVDGKLVAVPELKPTVVKMMKILSSGASEADMLAKLVEIDWKSHRVDKRTGKRRSVDGQPARVVIGRLYGWSTLYTRGEYLYRIKNAFEKVDSFAGVPVVKRPPLLNRKTGHLIHDAGELQLLLQVAPPKGGWATKPVRDAFEAAARANTLAVLVRRAALKTAASKKGKKVEPVNPLRPVGAHILEEDSSRLIHGEILPPSYARGYHLTDERGASRRVPLNQPFHGFTWTVGGSRMSMKAEVDGYFSVWEWPAGSNRSGYRPFRRHRNNPGERGRQNRQNPTTAGKGATR